MPILNYTTKIKADKTVSEIQQILAAHGASKMIVDYHQGNPVALSFVIHWNDMPTAFAMPCRFMGVLKAMKSDKKVPRSSCTEDQALRTGWRILKDWVEAQMAIVESEIASMPEIFLPYSVSKTGSTLYEFIEQNRTPYLLEN